MEGALRTAVFVVLLENKNGNGWEMLVDKVSRDHVSNLSLRRDQIGCWKIQEVRGS